MWNQEKKRTVMALVIDNSGSMDGEPMIAARSAAANFIQRMNPNDYFHLFVFNSGVTKPYSGFVRDVGSNAVSYLNNLLANGGTALFQATIDSILQMNQTKSQDIQSGTVRNYGILLMTDGMNNFPPQSIDSVYSVLPNGESADQIHIYSVSFGSSSDDTTLRQLATATNGAFFKASSSTIDSIYAEINLEL